MLALIILNAVTAIFCGIVAGIHFEKENGWQCFFNILLVLLNLSIMSFNINTYAQDNKETTVVIVQTEKEGKNISFHTARKYTTPSDLETVSTQIGDTCIFNGKGKLVKNISLERRIQGE